MKNSLNRRHWTLHCGMPKILIALFSLAFALQFVSCRSTSLPDQPLVSEAAFEQTELPIMCRVELRSFIVAGRGRHLYLLIEAPEGYEQFSGRVEYTTATYREDYTAPADRSGAARVAKMSRGRPLYPLIANAQDRLEAEFEVTLEQAICLQQDRVFAARYALLGTNSSSGLRRAMEECDCELPRSVLAGRGTFGEFPGIDLDPGPVLERERWADFGIVGEPVILLPSEQPEPVAEAP